MVLFPERNALPEEERRGERGVWVLADFVLSWLGYKGPLPNGLLARGVFVTAADCPLQMTE